jgi:lipid A disaccharide synthetase
MNKEPVIIQFDEDESFFTVVDLICFNMDLKLAARAKNIEQARHLVKQIETKVLKPDIAIISDYLGNSFDDGMLLTKKIKSLNPQIKVIAYVTDPEIQWGDILAIKGSKSADRTLTMALTELTGKTFKASNITESQVQ